MKQQDLSVLTFKFVLWYETHWVASFKSGLVKLGMLTVSFFDVDVYSSIIPSVDPLYTLVGPVDWFWILKLLLYEYMNASDQYLSLDKSESNFNSVKTPPVF